MNGKGKYRPSGITSQQAVTRALAGQQVDSFVAHKFGKNETTASGDAIMEPGGAFPYLTWTTAKAVRVKVGGNAADAAAGTGARTVTVQGLDGDFNIAAETITLAGASASSATTATFSRVLRVFVETAGSGRVNAGDVVIEWSDASGDLATVLAGEGQSQLGFITVPYGYRMLLTHVLLGTSVSSGSATVIVDGFIREGANVVSEPFESKRVFYELEALSRENGEVEQNFEEPLVFSEYTDLWFEAVPSAGTPVVTVAFTCIFERVRKASVF